VASGQVERLHGVLLREQQLDALFLGARRGWHGETCRDHEGSGSVTNERSTGLGRSCRHAVLLDRRR
jgi:hypothetical protein